MRPSREVRLRVIRVSCNAVGVGPVYSR